MIRKADTTLKERWRSVFAALSPEARDALRLALGDLATDARGRAEHAWRKHKGPMALYWRVVSVYAGHLRRAIPIGGAS